MRLPRGNQSKDNPLAISRVYEAVIVLIYSQQYFDAVLSDGSGKGMVVPNVICMHEQDNGIGWKHR